MSSVLVTGSSQGIGQAAAEAIARRGLIVYASMRQASDAGPLVEVASTDGLDIRPVELDVTDPASIEAAFARILSDDADLVGVVNNAGQAHVGPVENISTEDALHLFDVNVFGPLRVMQQALPHFRTKGAGRIVNVSSVTARIPGVPFDGLYTATKCALAAITESAHIELAPFGVSCCLIEPGFVATKIYDNAIEQQLEGVYAADLLALKGFLASTLANAPGPLRVAEVIADAVTEQGGAVHRLAGNDAEGLLMAAQAMGEADWLAFARGTLLSGAG